ncbi:hypothetical protein [Nonomuraea sp. NPDC050310]|uniref:hypothetical protein n=1 Tax=Nonomuraea sp. NPDC050310 TaxID=3154935 RepID=UPI0033F14946
MFLGKRSPFLVLGAAALAALPPLLNPAMPWAWTPWLPDSTLRTLAGLGLLDPLMVADLLTGSGLSGLVAVVALLLGHRKTALAVLLPCAAASFGVGGAALPYGLALTALAALAGYAYVRPSHSVQYRSASF